MPLSLASAIAVCFATIAGIRDCGLFCPLRGHPRLRCVVPLSRASAIAVCFAFARASAMRLVAQALPLCGAAPTFFAAAKKVGKESR
ncbi:hypothetical protein J8I87_42380, partial [Paraburkholderia sp. LEh10]|uniref:hypothetical protein n=1 Tax=Paraburkholderia sp. LEh10 TaxID=2821353 RepID=UPI001B1534B6|nr:hypothetical protein [Paraburkholderia sp. LEh10]